LIKAFINTIIGICDFKWLKPFVTGKVIK